MEARRHRDHVTHLWWHVNIVAFLLQPTLDLLLDIRDGVCFGDLYWSNLFILFEAN